MEMRFIIRRIVIIALMIFACFLLQTSIFSHIRIAGVVPNLLIIVTSSFGFMKGRRFGGIVGFCCGIILDLFNGALFGFYALVFLIIGYLNGMLRKLFYGDDLKLPLLFVAMSDLLYGFVVYLAMFFIRSKVDIGFYFMNIMMPEMVYTVCAMIPLYFLLEYAMRKMDQVDTKRSAHRVD